jgi:hypothetical protein
VRDRVQRLVALGDGTVSPSRPARPLYGPGLRSTVRGYNRVWPAMPGPQRSTEKEVGLMIFLLFGLLILAATGHLFLR